MDPVCPVASYIALHGTLHHEERYKQGLNILNMNFEIKWHKLNVCVHEIHMLKL